MAIRVLPGLSCKELGQLKIRHAVILLSGNRLSAASAGKDPKHSRLLLQAT